MQQFTKKSMFASDAGGVVEVVSFDGELLASIAVPAGLVPVANYLALVPLGAELQVSSGLSVLTPPSSVGILAYGKGSHDTGANPDFRPMGSAERLQKEMLQTMRQVQASTKRLEAREKALASIERIPSPKPSGSASAAAADVPSMAVSPESSPPSKAKAKPLVEPSAE